MKIRTAPCTLVLLTCMCACGGDDQAGEGVNEGTTHDAGGTESSAADRSSSPGTPGGGAEDRSWGWGQDGASPGTDGGEANAADGSVSDAVNNDSTAADSTASDS